jgi:hypothetical protein
MKAVILSFLVVLVLSICSVNIQGQHFQKVWSSNPYMPMTVIIDSALIDGYHLQEGDEIGVFDSNTITQQIFCVGSLILEEEFLADTNLFIITSTNDPTTPGILDGFTNGHQIVFRIWDSSEEVEFILVGKSFNLNFTQTHSPLESSMAAIQGYSFLTWTGNVSNDWNNPSNWIIPVVPNESIKVLIPETAQGAHFPVITSSANCKKISLEEGSHITIQGILTVSDTLNQ